MGYVVRFRELIRKAADCYAISLPILFRKHNEMYEAVFLYTVRKYRVQHLGDIAMRSIETGKTEIVPIRNILNADEVEDILTSTVIFRKNPQIRAMREAYLTAHDVAVAAGRWPTDAQLSQYGELIESMVPSGGVMKLYRALAKDYFKNRRSER